MNELEKKLQHNISRQLLRYKDKTALTEGLVVMVLDKGQPIAHVEWGTCYQYYDLASLTKILFTTSAVMLWWQKQQHWPRLSQVFPWWDGHPQARIKSLLNHSAGFEWWYPFYKTKSSAQDSLSRSKMHHGSSTKSKVKPALMGSVIKDRWSALEDRIASIPLREDGMSVYSDLDFLLLARWIQKDWEQDLIQAFAALQEYVQAPTLHFNSNNQTRFNGKTYAPTKAYDDQPGWRQGIVNDNNTLFLNGVSTHAGLFGSLTDVETWFHWLRDSYHGRRGTGLRAETAKHFCQRSLPRSQGDWGLGFMKPSADHASCGKDFSLTSVGHTAFTGPSLWWDIKRDLAVIVLANRRLDRDPTREFFQFRAKIHDWIVQSR